MKSVDVVAGLIVEEARLLVCQRKNDASFPLKWEFPGGKVERGEQHENALRRELHEELGIRVEQITEIYCHEHKYSLDFAVNLRFYRVHSYTGQLMNLTFQQLKWCAIGDLPILDFLDGDLPLVHWLVSSQGRWLLV